MNAQDYISSGILELYVTGALNDSERREVEGMAQQFPEVQAELTEIEKAMEDYALAHAIAPPAAMLDRIMESVEKPIPVNGKTIHMHSDIKPAPGRLRYLAYAASILLLISFGINIYYYYSLEGVQEELAAMHDQNTFLTDQYDVVRASNKELALDMQVYENKSFMPITMKGQAVSPQSMSVVYWDKSSGDVYVNAMNLPEPTSGMQYQLWALKDGKPIDAGMFDVNGELQQMKKIMEADAFAVTLEPMGGSAVPSLDRLYVMAGV